MRLEEQPNDDQALDQGTTEEESLADTDAELHEEGKRLDDTTQDVGERLAQKIGGE